MAPQEAFDAARDGADGLDQTIQYPVADRMAGLEGSAIREGIVFEV